MSKDYFLLKDEEFTALSITEMRKAIHSCRMVIYTRHDVIAEQSDKLDEEIDLYYKQNCSPCESINEERRIKKHILLAFFSTKLDKITRKWDDIYKMEKRLEEMQQLYSTIKQNANNKINNEE